MATGDFPLHLLGFQSSDCGEGGSGTQTQIGAASAYFLHDVQVDRYEELCRRIGRFEEDFLQWVKIYRYVGQGPAIQDNPTDRPAELQRVVNWTKLDHCRNPAHKGSTKLGPQSI